MGTKYSSQSASGYNASPPSDDGTAVSTNEVKWSFIKTKLGDPIKTLADNINTALGTHFDESVLDNTGALTTTAAHHKRTINQTNSGTISLGDAATMAAGYIVTVKNSHTAANTVDLVTGADTLDGTAAGSVSLAPDASMTFVTTLGADGYLKTSMNIGDDLTIANDLTVTNNLTVTGTATVTGGQISFPATQAASADANTLDDYEEGTFTPTIVDASFNDSEGQTYTAQTGIYTKIGNTCFFWMDLDIISLGTLTTSNPARIQNMPFTAGGTTAGYYAVSVGLGTSLSITSGESVGGWIQGTTDRIDLTLWSSTQGTASMTLAEVSSGARFIISGSYPV